MRRRPDGRTERIAVVRFRVTGDADDFDLVTQVCLETAAYEIERWTCSRMSLAPTGPRPNRRRTRRTRRGYFDSSHLLLTVRERVPQRDASNASRPNASDHWPWPRTFPNESVIRPPNATGPCCSLWSKAGLIRDSCFFL